MAYSILSHGDPTSCICASPLDLSVSDFAETEQEMQTFLSYWLQLPISRGPDITSVPVPLIIGCASQECSSIDLPLQQSFLGQRPLAINMPVGCKPAISALLKLASPKKWDVESLPQVVAASTPALLLEMLDPTLFEVHVGTERKPSDSQVLQTHLHGSIDPTTSELRSYYHKIHRQFHNFTCDIDPVLSCRLLDELHESLTQDPDSLELFRSGSELPSALNTLPQGNALLSGHDGCNKPSSFQRSKKLLSMGFSTPRILLKSFRVEDQQSHRPYSSTWPPPSVLIPVFMKWTVNGDSLILDSLFNALEDMQVPSPAIRDLLLQSPDKGSMLEPFFEGTYYSDCDAAYVIFISLCAIISSLPASTRVPSGQSQGSSNYSNKRTGAVLSEPAHRLAKRLVKVLGARRYFDEIEADDQDRVETISSPECVSPTLVPDIKSTCRAWRYIMEYIHDLDRSNSPFFDDSNPIMSTRSNDPFFSDVLTILSAVISRNWTPSFIHNRWAASGSALDLFLDCRNHAYLWKINTGDNDLTMVYDKLDNEVVVEHFLSWTPVPNYRHILEFTPTFQDKHQRKVIRNIHNALMFRGFVRPLLQINQLATVSRDPSDGYVPGQFLPPMEFDRDEVEWESQRQALGTALSPYLYLLCHRSSLFDDAVNALWGRSPKELIRPLKVKLTRSTGELGVDAGGVSQEFFSNVFQGIFEDSAGYFQITDDRTNAVYFRPRSERDLSMFTMIGLLLGLAFHNGCTVSANFPVALYMKLVGWSVSRLDQISDDWPTLTAGFKSLASWDERANGVSVEEAFFRTYTFPISIGGTVQEVDMQKYKSKPWDGATVTEEEDEHIPMVNSQNKGQYLCDYVDWLVNKSVEPQFHAFADGFYAALDNKRHVMKVCDRNWGGVYHRLSTDRCLTL